LGRLRYDTFAIGLIKATEIIEDGRVDGFVKERYSSFGEGIGKKIIGDKATLKELSEYALQKGTCEMPGSGRQKRLEAIVNQILFKG
jgi:xylose isomerase